MKTRNQRTKIYSTENIFIYESGQDSYSLEGRLDGKRIRQRAKTLDQAKALAHALEEGVEAKRVFRSALSPEQLRDAEQATASLPSGVTLMDALSYYLENYSHNSITVEDAVWKILETKESRSAKTYEDSKSRLLKFAKWSDGKALAQIDRSDASSFLQSVPQGSFNHYLRHCKGLYIWAMNEGEVEANPFAHIKPQRSEHTEVGLLSNDECKALLDAARRVNGGELLAYTAICLFAGLRPDSEMRALSWEALNLEDAELRVVKGKTKTPRTVDLSPNLLEWLMICDRKKPIYPPVGFRKKWAKVRNAAGFKGGVALMDARIEKEEKLKPWKFDSTRHTAVTNKVRISKDIGKSATWAGHAVSVCQRHYLGLVSSSDASDFWSITPAISGAKEEIA